MNNIFLSSILAIILLCSVFTMNSAFGTDSIKEAKKVDVKKKMSDAKKAEKIKLAKERYVAKKDAEKKVEQLKKSEIRKDEERKIKYAEKNKAFNEMLDAQSKPPLTLDELKQIALDDINKWRKGAGFKLLSLGSAKSAQLYSDELFIEECIPIVSERENIVLTGFGFGGGSFEKRPEEIISQLNYEMMFRDAKYHWGHRYNFLDPQYESVSIGISYSSGKMVMVQDFESMAYGNIPHYRSFEIKSMEEWEKICLNS